MANTSDLIVGAAVGGIVVYLLMKQKKKECPKCGAPISVAAFPAPAPPPPPPPPPPKPEPTPLPPNPPAMPETKSFVGFYGWGGVK